MFVPLILAALFGYVTYSLGKGKSDPLKVGGETLGDGGYKVYGAPSIRQSSVGYLPKLIATIQQGLNPTFDLLSAAYDEALAIGDAQAVALIESLATARMQANPGGGSQDVPADEPQQHEIVISETANTKEAIVTPPIDTATSEGWRNFLSAVRTRKPEWSNEKYIGCFEQNRNRLAELGFNPDSMIGNFDAQYDALCKDVKDYCSDPLIEKFKGKTIDINGNQVTCSQSGILGLMKAAGRKGAESWLTNSNDRQAFPQTTELFNRCNNCF